MAGCNPPLEWKLLEGLRLTFAKLAKTFEDGLLQDHRAQQWGHLEHFGQKDMDRHKKHCSHALFFSTLVRDLDLSFAEARW